MEFSPQMANQLVREYANRYIEHAQETWRRFVARKSADEQPILVPLTVTLPTAGGATIDSSSSWNAAGNKILLVDQILPVCAFRAATTESLTITGLGNLDVENRQLLKAMNALVTLSLTDDPYEVMQDKTGVPLSTFPIRLAEGKELVVPPNYAAKVRVELVDTTAAVYGGSTTYGLLLVGKYTRVPNGEK